MNHDRQADRPTTGKPSEHSVHFAAVSATHLFTLVDIGRVIIGHMPRPLDDIDRRLIAALDADPKISHAQLARDLDIARGTVYSRLDRLEHEGVITGYGPEIGPAAAGFDVLAFCTLEIAQGSHDETTRAIAAIDEVVEIHTVTGPGDLLVRVVARSNDHLHEVLQRITHIPSVLRSQSQLALATSLSRSVVHLVTA